MEFHAFEGGFLDEDGDVVEGDLVEFNDVVDEGFVGDYVAYAPAGHSEGFAEPVADDVLAVGAVVKYAFSLVKRDCPVDFVGEYGYSFLVG